MESSWRKFEWLVARIEEILAPEGVVIKSPDRIKDLVTGQMREVDASIRYKVGSTPILITIECRERAGVQDDTWIEQLATKRNKIGAAKTIAVSSTGFTKPAVRSARFHNIELRQINDITDDEITRKWADGLIVNMHLEHYNFKLLQINYDIDTKLEGLEISPAITDSYLKDSLSTTILYATKDNQALTINDLIVAHSDNSDVIVGGPIVSKKISIEFPKHAYYSYSNFGRIDVVGVTFEFDVSESIVNVPIEKISEYVEHKQPIIKVAERTIPIKGGKIVILNPKLEDDPNEGACSKEIK